MKKKTEDELLDDYIKANRKGNREAELEISTGFVSKHKVHKSKKNYSRKEKHKKELSNKNDNSFFILKYIFNFTKKY